MSYRETDPTARSMRIAIFLPSWIGDAAMATPALRAVRQHYGSQAQLIGVARTYVESVLAGNQHLDDWISYQPHLRGRWSLVKRLRRTKIDLALLLSNSLSTALLAWCSGAHRRIGFARHWRSPLLTDRLHAPRLGHTYQPRSAVDHYLDVARAVGCPIKSRRLELTTTPRDERLADQVWQHPGLRTAAQVVVLNTGSANGSAKSWPLMSFAELAVKLVRQRNVACLVICGPGERVAAEEVVQRAAHPRVTGLDRWPLGIGLSKACIRRGDCVVTTDSGPRHLAAAFGVPSIALFGPTDPRWSHNYHDRETILSEHPDCGPCGQSRCPLHHHRCMRDLSVDRVLNATLHQLDQVRRRRSA